MIKKNILIHAINWIWLWHIKRTLILAKKLRHLKEIWEIIFVTNSSNPFLITNEWFRVEKLDYWIEDTLKVITFEKYENESFKIINKIINDNNINIFIHDTYFIKQLLLKRKDLRHFLILRDSNFDYLNSIKDLFPSFRKIFIPHIKEEITSEKQNFLSFFSNIFYTWYLVESLKVLDKKQKNIVVSPWYWWDYENIKQFFTYINKFLSSNKLIKWYKVLFILWKHFDQLQKEISFKPEFTLIKFEDFLSEKLWQYTLFIWRGGYNTLNEIVSSKLPSMLFSVTTFNESQESRIDFFINDLKIDFIKKWSYDLKKDAVILEELLVWKFIENKNIDNKELFFWAWNVVNEIKKDLNKENVLVFKHIFLPNSENFIFEELKSFNKINPIIVTLKKEYLDIFPNSFELIYNSGFNGLLQLDYPKIKNKDLYIKFLKYLFCIIKENNIKVIYTEFLFDAYFICKIKKIYKDIKIFSAWRWFDVYSFLDNNYVNKLEFFSSLDWIFVRDKNMKNNILESWFKKVEIIRSVINLWEYKFIEKDFSKLEILIWWRFTQKKNLLELLDLIKKLHETNIANKIWIVWDWELYEEIIWKVENLELKKYITFYWFLEHKDLLKVINEYNCFINYSKKALSWDDEWIPNLILENILSGNLVFSSITGWIWELFDMDNCSSLFLDIQKDFEKINLVCKNWKEIEQSIRNNYEKVLKMYKWENSILKLENKLLNYE